VAEGRGKLQAESNDERAHKYLNIAPGETRGRILPIAGKGSEPSRPPLRSTGDYSDGSGLTLPLGLGAWMSTAIVVTPRPYFAVTDQYGRFVIERFPAGEYEMEGTEDLGAKINGFLFLRARRALSRWFTTLIRRRRDVIL